MNDPLISIVLPTYNGENSGLDASIESCLNQTYRNFELIIVNDGSTDRTEEIVREWLDKDERIKLINHGVNKNLPTALNTGFAAAKGDYLTWTSDDNQYKPKALQRMLETLQENPDVDMVYCDYEKVVTMEQDFIGHGTRGIVDDPGELINFGGVVCGCFLYKKEVRELVGDYNTDYFMAEDYEYWLRVAANCKMQPLHEILYYYTYSDSCMSAARAHKVWELFNPMLRMQYAKTWKYYSRPKRSAKYLENAMIYREVVQKRDKGTQEKYGVPSMLGIYLTAFRIAPLSFLLVVASTRIRHVLKRTKRIRNNLLAFRFGRKQKYIKLFGFYLLKYERSKV